LSAAVHPDNPGLCAGRARTDLTEQVPFLRGSNLGLCNAVAGLPITLARHIGQLLVVCPLSEEACSLSDT
jgi:hypothetical protein